PIVASNLRCDPPARAACARLRSDVIVDRGAERIGILATISPDVLPEIAPARRAGLIIDDPIAAARAGVRRLRARGATRVLLMTQGPRGDRALATVDAFARALGSVAADRPDLILGGGLAEPESGRALRLLARDGAPPVVGAGSSSGAAAAAGADAGGIAELTRVVLPASGPVVDARPADSHPPDADVARTLAALGASYCARYGAPILARPPDAVLDRAAFTRVVLEVMRRRAGAEIAVINRGAIRDVPFPLRGAITAGDLEEALPYPAVIGAANVAGATVESALGPAATDPRTALAGPARGPGGLEINGRPLDKARAYRVATIAFVAEGGDGLFPRGTLAFAPLPDAPDLRAAVASFLRDEAAPGFDVERAFRPPAAERLLLVSLADLGLDLADTSIDNGAGYGDTQLARTQQTSLQGQLTAILQLRLPRHQDDTRLDMKYGWSRTRVPGAAAVAGENADIITFASLYSYRGLRELGAPRALAPDPYVRMWVESEFTRPAVTPTQPRAYHHLLAQPTAGAVVTPLPPLKLRAGAGARRELLATGDAARWQPVVEAGATLDPTAIATVGALAIKLEATIDYLFVDPADQRAHELRAAGKLSIPLVPLLFLTAGINVYGVERQREGFAAAVDSTIGLRLHLDAAYQRL
ncbi:MAG TPA: 5'-nucleotidase, partial [Polyangia bacterium]|nr:5'-nucleotidase [Polyangia bacterium]